MLWCPVSSLTCFFNFFDRISSTTKFWFDKLCQREVSAKVCKKLSMFENDMSFIKISCDFRLGLYPLREKNLQKHSRSVEG